MTAGVTIFSFAELAEEAKREVNMRYKVYGRDGRAFTPQETRRIAMMEEIARHFHELAETERLV